MIRTIDWTVEKAERKPGWLLIRQIEHARLAGELVQRWNTVPQWLTLEPIRAAFIWSAFHHDDGWQAWDAQPSFDESNRPVNFTEMDREDSRPMWAESIRLAEQQSSISALLVAAHFVHLDDSPGDPTAADPEQRAPSDFTQQFSAQIDAWRATSIKELSESGTHSAEQVESELETAIELLRFFDWLSLVVCIGGLKGKEELAFSGSTLPDRTAWQIERCGPTHYAISPSPFDPSDCTLDLEVTKLPTTELPPGQLIQTQRMLHAETICVHFC